MILSTDMQVTVGAWYVAFVPGPRTYWWDWLSPAWCRHCFAFGYHAMSDRWLVYDVEMSRTVLIAIEPEDMAPWLDEMRRNHGMRCLHVETGDGAPWYARMGLYCVSAVKHLIGARSGALRPVGLWRDLLKAGATPAFTGDAHGTAAR